MTQNSDPYENAVAERINGILKQEFSIDKSDEESGLNEAVKFLSVGDKAKLILPSHLAHGLLGDLDKIPPQSILLIDVQLIKIK